MRLMVLLLLPLSLALGYACGNGDEADDCVTLCREGTGGPPANGCAVVGGQERCVYTCSDDADCLAPFYQGCSGQTDDGVAICEVTPP